MTDWLYRVTCYYVNDPDLLVKLRPDMVKRAGSTAEVRAQAGQIAIQTVHKSTHSRDIEVAAGESRADIGRVAVTDEPPRRFGY